MRRMEKTKRKVRGLGEEALMYGGGVVPARRHRSGGVLDVLRSNPTSLNSRNGTAYYIWCATARTVLLMLVVRQLQG